MAKIDLSTVYKVTAKGRAYYYAWRPGRGEGKEARLKSPPGTAAFVRELAEKLEARGTGDKSKLKAVIVAYKRSEKWRGLSAKTRQNWQPWLDRIQVKFGDVSLAAFDRPAMKKVIKKWRDGYKNTPRSADMGVQALSNLLSFAVDEGELANNIAFGIERLYRNDRADIIWNDDDLRALAAVAAPEIMWAARLGALTGIRQGDLLKMTWADVRPQSIEVTTGKSRNRKTTLIPIYGELRELLDSIPKRSTRVLTNTEGRPWQTGFGSSWQKTIQRAGIDKHFHDLRGTAATRFYLAGFSIREIAELMTWDEEHVEKLINMYVRKGALLEERIRRMDEARTAAAKPAAKLSGGECA
jgi:integrase